MEAGYLKFYPNLIPNISALNSNTLFPLTYMYGGKSTENPSIPMGTSLLFDVPAKFLPPCDILVRNLP